MKRFFADGYFLTALALAPAVWLLLAALQGVRLSPNNFDIKVILYTVLLYPVLEELAFRGAIQGWLRETTAGLKSLLSIGDRANISVANLATSVLFAAAHLFNQPPLWAALIFFPSLVFGFFRDRTDSVVPSIILHSWYNLGFVLLFS